MEKKQLYNMCLCCAVLSRAVMSDSLWPHGLQAARLLCPWGFSRHYHALLQGIFPTQGSKVSCIAGGFLTLWALKEACFFATPWLFKSPTPERWLLGGQLPAASWLCALCHPRPHKGQKQLELKSSCQTPVRWGARSYLGLANRS